MTRALAAFALLICATACASRLPDVPTNVVVQDGAWTGRPTSAPIVAPNDAPPRIERMYFNTLDVKRGEGQWNGSFVTGTNVASVEVRTNLFSIDVPRTAFGKFAFSVDVLDLPPIFIRDYRLRVLARNSAGVVDEEDLPLHIR